MAPTPLDGTVAERPRQVVILAGGRGTRLRPLTDTQPKPMIAFHGRPFLEYLIEMLRERGFRRVLLLLGHLPEAITGFFGDGRRFGVEIEYSITDVDNDTGRRLKLAAPLIESRFLLAYCDNHLSIPFDAMWQAYRDGGTLAQITVYRNRDGYTRDNLRVDVDGFVTVYDKTRAAPELAGVDIGFLIADHAILNLLAEDDNVSFEATVYPQLVAARQLRAFETNHRYYSIGTPQRLPETKRFLARELAILLDRDGVLNHRMPRGTYVRSWEDWQWLPGAKEALRRLNEAGYRVIVVTNQAGVARGVLTAADLETIHDRMREEVQAVGGEIAHIYVCPHHWNDDCDCRKPKPGMLFKAQRDFHLDLPSTLFVGDDDRDRQAAEQAGCLFERVYDKISLLDVTRRLLKTP